MAKSEVRGPAPRTWLFDVDGTLTPPRAPMPAEFAGWMAHFVQQHDVCLVTGGTWERIEYQCGPALARSVRAAYLCNGNEARTRGKLLYSRRATPPASVQAEIEAVLRQPVPWTHAPAYLEHRPGMVTISGLPPSAPTPLREAFERWDAQAGWRRRCAERLQRACPQWRCQVAGQTSLDLFEAGADKSQALCFEGSGPLWLFADAVHPQGNDWTLAQALLARKDGSRVFAVRDWRHTWGLLRALTPSAALPASAPREALMA